MTDVYIVQKLENNKDIIVNVPGSKSITNRALMLAALSDGECNLDAFQTSFSAGRRRYAV